jgi:hypothetical protein
MDGILDGVICVEGGTLLSVDAVSGEGVMSSKGKVTATVVSGGGGGGGDVFEGECSFVFEEAVLLLRVGVDILIGEAVLLIGVGDILFLLGGGDWWVISRVF